MRARYSACRRPRWYGIAGTLLLLVGGCRDRQLSTAPSSSQTSAPVSSPRSGGPADAGFAERSASQLIELYVFEPDCGFRTFPDDGAYGEALAHNNAISAELKQRGESAAGPCRQHLSDTRNIFTGHGGPPLNVATVCHDLLTALGRPPSKPVTYRFCGNQP